MAEPHDPLANAPEQFRAWRQLAEAALKSRPFSTLQSVTRDGIVIEPLYVPASDAQPISGRGAQRWAVVQVLDDPDPARANEQARRDLEGGSTGLSLRFAGGPLAPNRGLPPTQEALAVALEDVDVAAVHLRLEPHPRGPVLAGWLRDLIARRAIAPELAAISFGLDPLAGVLQGENEADRCEPFAEVATALQRSGFTGPVAELDGRPFHEAGSTEAQELAAVLAAGAWWLRALVETGVVNETAFHSLGASLAVDCDQFLSIAKVRALRLLWARLQELCGAAPTRLPIHAETSRRMLTAAAAHTNLVRATIAAFAAGVGGADSVAVRPFSAALDSADDAARALARNTHHLLIEEANVHRVADPSAGSGAVEAMTETLAEAAWAEFRRIEAEGGIIQSLRSGALPARIAFARDGLRRELAEGAAPLVGSTVYPDPAETAVAAQGEVEWTGLLRPVRLEQMAAQR